MGSSRTRAVALLAARACPPEPAVEGALKRPLGAAARRAVAHDVTRWLHWQESLGDFAPQMSAVDAVPFVALYAHGHLRACMGSAEGKPRERLARAMLAALGDARFGGVRASDRASLAAEVTFMRSPRFTDEAELRHVLELGKHGIGIARSPKTGHAAPTPVFLLPTVARDSRLDAAGMVAALRRKAGPAPGRLFVFEADRVVARRGAAARVEAWSARDAGASWLAGLVAWDGTMTFARDARTGAPAAVGTMHHARAATAIEALAAHGGHDGTVKKARAKLRDDARAALSGRTVAGWPERPAEIAGTLALALRAGVELRPEALAYVTAHTAQVTRAPWHAGQVASALARATPRPIWDACLRDLARQPWAPWTVFAFHARGETSVRAVEGLVASIRRIPPYEGGVAVTGRAEVALTAVTAEALALYPSVPGAREALRRARRFLLAQQLTAENLPAPYAADPAVGAFTAAPASSLLRADVTGHALLALG